MAWWLVRLAFSNEKGAVTAEFMMLFPTLLLALAGAIGLFQLGLARLELSQLAFYQARSEAIGSSGVQSDKAIFKTEINGQLLCVTASRKLIFELRETGCYLIHGA